MISELLQLDEKCLFEYLGKVIDVHGYLGDKFVFVKKTTNNTHYKYKLEVVSY